MLDMNKILVIDDEEDIRINIQDLLEINGFEVLTASDGKEGLGMVLNTNPDLIICDINMPEMNGLDLIKELKQYPQFYTIPFLFLTANAGMDFVRTGMGLGADDYITKPYKGDELIKAVNIRLDKSKRIKEAFTTKLDDLKKNITFSIPSELKNSLDSIMSFSKLLMGNLDGFNYQNMDNIVTHIHDSGARLLRLIENYSYYSNLLSENINSNELYSDAVTNPADIIVKCSNLVQDNFPQKVQFVFDFCDDTPITLNVKYFEKIIYELVDNAVKFSTESKPIKIVSIVIGGSYIVGVINMGRGMTKEEINNIDSFTQFRRDDHEQQGLGLGLAIVIQILKIIGGKLKIESVLGDYTAARVYFPIG